MSREDPGCQPGDITITPAPSGWIVGRALKQIGPGPWWSFIAIFADFEPALRETRRLAKHEGVHACYHEGGMVYRPIPLDDSPYSPADAR